MRARRACICGNQRESASKIEPVKIKVICGKKPEENILVKGEMAKNLNAEDAEIRRKARFNFFKVAERISQCSIR